MNRWDAQFYFWASFGYPVYESSDTRDKNKITYPYITFDAVSAEINNNTIVEASVWTRNILYNTAQAIADDIQKRFENGKTRIRYDNNRYIWYTAEPNFIQFMRDEDDEYIRRAILTMTIHW